MDNFKKSYCFFQSLWCSVVARLQVKVRVHLQGLLTRVGLPHVLKVPRAPEALATGQGQTPIGFGGGSFLEANRGQVIEGPEYQ